MDFRVTEQDIEMCIRDSITVQEIRQDTEQSAYNGRTGGRVSVACQRHIRCVNTVHRGSFVG